MLGRRSKPLMGKLIGPAAGRVDGGATSPRSPLELRTHSPRGLKSYDLGGVGLGIVAALEKSGNFGTQNQAFNKKPFCNRNLIPTKPIPVNSSNATATSRCRRGGFEAAEIDSLEDYTFVTCRGPGNKAYTRVYCDGAAAAAAADDDKIAVFDRRSVEKTTNCPVVFTTSPAPSSDFSAYPTSDFLSSCHLCQKKLHGKDIYMYRGEKAFCSPECRYTQIVMDERKEKCSSEASSRSVEVSSAPYTSDQIFSYGILAT